MGSAEDQEAKTRSFRNFLQVRFRAAEEKKRAQPSHKRETVGPEDLRFSFRSLLHVSEGNSKQKGGNGHDLETDERVRLADGGTERMADNGWGVN
jgi:hypothetical protein